MGSTYPPAAGEMTPFSVASAAHRGGSGVLQADAGTVRAAEAAEIVAPNGHNSPCCCVVPPPGMGRQDLMATDYDQPRTDDELGEDSLEELKARRDAQAGAVDVDEAELAESLELPGADLSGEELTVRVVPKQVDEFTCNSCFLVRHRSQLANEKKMICRECAQ